MQIHIDFELYRSSYKVRQKTAYDNATKKGRIGNYYLINSNREPWKELILDYVSQYPNVFEKPKNGNGTNVKVGNRNLKASSDRCLFIDPHDWQKTPGATPVSISWYSLKTITIDTDNSIIIVNNDVAIKYS